MNDAVKTITEAAEVNELDINDLGNLVVSILRENLNDPIGSLIYKAQVKEETDKLIKVANEIASQMEKEYEREVKKRENKTS